MRGHYALLTLSAYLVALLVAMSAPALDGFTTGFRLLGLLLAVALGYGFMRWVLTFAPVRMAERATETDWDAPAFD